VVRLLHEADSVAHGEPESSDAGLVGMAALRLTSGCAFPQVVDGYEIRGAEPDSFFIRHNGDVFAD